MALQPPIAGTAKNPNKRIVSKTYDNFITEISYKGVSFPITNINTKLEHNLVIHEYPDRDSGHVEATGRKPIVVSATALFYNHIKPGKPETWTAGKLFPSVYRDFITAAQDAKDGTLQHPFWGELNVKCQRADTKMEADARGGVSVEVEWVETISLDLNSDKNSTAQLQAEADDFTNELDTVALTIPEAQGLKLTIGGLIDAITGVVDSINLFGQRLLGLVDRLLYRLQRLIDALNRLNNTLHVNLKAKAIRLFGTAIKIKQSINAALGSLRKYRVPTDTTLAALANRLSVDVVSLMKLNPRLASRPTVKANTIVIYEAV